VGGDDEEVGGYKYKRKGLVQKKKNQSHGLNSGNSSSEGGKRGELSGGERVGGAGMSGLGGKRKKRKESGI